MNQLPELLVSNWILNLDHSLKKTLTQFLGPFSKEELDSVLRKIKNRKAAGLDEISPEVWKT